MNETRKGDWMQTYIGRQFWPIDPRPEDIDIEDIAHALSMMCRFNGHSKFFYSVAEHSILISRSLPDDLALWGLLHDASEAYIADIVRPAKRFISGYAEVEENLMSAICDKFGLPHEMPPEVKAADNAILVDEMEQVMGPRPAEWSVPDKGLGVTISAYGPRLAKQLFLERFYELV